MTKAFFFALRQLFDPDILKVVGKVMLTTLALFAILGVAGWQAIDRWGPPWMRQPGAEYGALVALILTLTLGWFLFRAAAMLMMGIFSDQVVAIVERKYFPAAAKSAKTSNFVTGLRLGLASAGRALGYNLLALPLYAWLLLTGIGLVIGVVLVNALLLGRDLQDMVMARHRNDGLMTSLNRRTRFSLGAIVALLFLVPIVNFFTPVIGAAMAVKLVHARPEMQLKKAKP